MDVLTVKEVAERMRVSVAVVYQLCTARRLAHFRVGLGRGTIRIHAADLAAFVAGNAMSPHTTSAAGLKHIKPPSVASPE